MILSGDVGGTKTVLALYKLGGEKIDCIQKQTFLCARYSSFQQILSEFLGQSGKPDISAACLGVAGPIIDGDCYLTNLGWTISQRELIKILKTSDVCLINDLEAAAWGVLNLPQDAFVELNLDAEQVQGNVAVLAAGTGLGEAIMCWDGSCYHPIATEGGHTDFAPNNDQEMRLLNFLRQQYPDHVSYERLVSGEGLHNLYQFLKHSEGKASPEIEQAIKAIEDAPSVIGEAGVSGKDALCRQALKMFCRIFGAEAGNLALKCLPYGGVYLAGGIAPKILPMLQEGYFLEGFLGKGRYHNILKKMPVRICLNPEAGLLGAFQKALALMESTESLR